MIWRDKVRDLAILYSLLDDLKLFWQLKASRWDKLEAKVFAHAEHASTSSLVDRAQVAASFKKLLLLDRDYQEMRFRIKNQLKQALAIAQFIGRAPLSIEKIKFTPLLQYDLIERYVEEIEHQISLCREASYLKRHSIQGLKTPLKFLRSLCDFYLFNREEHL